MNNEPSMPNVLQPKIDPDGWLAKTASIWPKPTTAAQLATAWQAAVARGESPSVLYDCAVEYVIDISQRLCKNAGTHSAEQFYSPTGDYRVYMSR